LAETDRQEMYDVLQVSPTAEPEVVAAAYRALAKKYHPDRSNAPDAMNRMARLNVAYQALKGAMPRGSRSDGGPSSGIDTITPFGVDRIDASGTLEDVFAAVARRVSTVRHEIIDEVVQAGVARDMAGNLVTQAVKETFQVEAPGINNGPSTDFGHLDSNSSYEDALQVTVARAAAARDGVADTLVRDGLQRSAATELADSAFERIRKTRDTSHSSKARLSSEQVDLSGSLERGMDIVVAKARVARQLVVDEIAQDGVPMRTAEELAASAFDRLLKTGHK